MTHSHDSVDCHSTLSQHMDLVEDVERARRIARIEEGGSE